jgi:hypothetical protein
MSWGGRGEPDEQFVGRYRARVIIGLTVLAVVVLAGLAVLQALLVAGRPLGHLAWGGQHQVLPRKLRIGSAVSIALYAVFAWLIVATAIRVSAVPEQRGGDVGIWLLTAYFTVGVVLNAISRSRPERLLMTPVCLVLAGGCLVIALH